MHLLDVDRDDRGRLLLTVETDQAAMGCRSCGVVAVGHGRREHRVHDAACFGTPTVVRWRRRVWRCPDPRCRWARSPRSTTSRRRAKLTTRAIGWATEALTHDDTTVSVLAIWGGLAHPVGRRRGRGHRPPGRQE